MSDRFQPLTTEQLARWIAEELKVSDSILGMPRALFFEPRPSDRFRLDVHGRTLETPIGVAAGPHSQLAGNIVMSWLCGARVIELKTVQILDEIDVPKPCIDMQDEGYNVEWSQELTVEQSLDEYVLGWILVHGLHRELGFEGDRPGVQFDVSVGYDLAGIQSEKMRRYLADLADASERIERHLEVVARFLPAAREIEIPSRLSDSVTLSTMHGCPPDEIGRIASHLIEEWGLHTAVKMNPTLLGPEEVRDIVIDRLGFDEVEVPDSAFDHDPTFPEAVALIGELQEVARRHDVSYGVKLSNTLEIKNHRSVFGDDMMYLSGRPLHVLVVRLAHRLIEAFGGDLAISFAGGVDAFNVSDLMASGLRPATTCSDLLRPGGYQRLLQYLENIDAAAAAVGADDLDGLIVNTDGGGGAVTDCARRNLARYSERLLGDPQYHQQRYLRQTTKTSRSLGFFDCIEAPCVDRCDTSQRVPEYLRAVRDGDLETAQRITLADNPLAAILGRACHRPCEPVCLRTHTDEPLAIREIKRYIMDHEKPETPRSGPTHDASVAIVGGGPCGLTVASYLAEAGFPVSVFEARPASGGMVSGTIPLYRTAQKAIDQDIRRIQAFGAEIRHGQRVGSDITLQSLRDEAFRYIVVAAGAQRNKRLGIDGELAGGVFESLDFLRRARSGEIASVVPPVLVIGGGDAAMDCARSARRLTDGEVMVLYRRSKKEMPAQPDELQDLITEGIDLEVLTTPDEVIVEDGLATRLRCLRMRLGEPDDSGRRRPEKIDGSEHERPVGTLLVAIGQEADLSLFGDSPPAVNRSGYLEVDPESFETTIPGVYAGGDVTGSGPASIVKAAGDGRVIADAIIQRECGTSSAAEVEWPEIDMTEMLWRRAHRLRREETPHAPASVRSGFDEVVLTLSDEAARTEAARCLDCDHFCSTCDSVCPNRAFFTYRLDVQTVELPRLEARDGGVTAIGSERFDVGQVYQVAVLTDLCNECGNCTTFCPTAGEPYKDKPRLYLQRREFDAESDNAFMVMRDGERWTAQGRFGGELHEILLDGEIHYSSPAARVRLDLTTLALRDGHSSADGELSLQPCAVLFTLVRGLRSMPGFPMPTFDRDASLHADLL